jgi:UDP-3-O-[3-hydroxymyristoyl] N-acetylglucosamine deacetylase
MEVFVHELCDSRTFCRNSDVQVMRSNGLALGGTLMNAVVIEGADVLSPGGMRHPDEPVRHKMLDAMGDLALAGGPIIGRYVGRARWSYADQQTAAQALCSNGCVSLDGL